MGGGERGIGQVLAGPEGGHYRSHAGPAITRPPLLATPGGAARRHLPVAVGRTNSCQKLW